MRILIAGCGDLGTALGRELAGGGHQVFGIRRRAALLPSVIQPIAADLARLDTPLGLPADLDLVYYTAAADASDRDAYERAYVAGLQRIVDELGDNALRRLVFVSSTSVYGQTDGSWVDESSPTEPTSFRGEVLLRGERIAHESSWPSTTVRLSGIYGPGRTYLIDAVRSGRARLADGPPEWTNRIHRDDAAGFLAHLADHDAAACYLGVDDEPAPRPDVLEWLAARIGVQLEGGTEAAGRRGGNKRCRNALLRSTGYELRFPTYREGYAQLLSGG